MKKILKGSVAVFAMLSVVFFMISLCSHSVKPCGNVVVWTMLISLGLGALISMIDFSKLMSKKVKKEEDKDGSQVNQVWPLWAFLALFIVIAILATACVYLAINMWCVRDLMNFELMSILSIITVRWFTYQLFTKKK